VRYPAAPMLEGFGGHVVEMAACALVLAGPLPWAAALARRDRGWTAALALLVTWSALETAVAIALAAAGELTRPAALATEGALVLAGLAVVGRPRLPEEVRPHALAPPLLAVAGLVAAALLVRLAATPIVDYDSLAYHLPAIAAFLHARRLVPLAQFPALSRYPFGWEALAALFVLPFGEDFLVALPNLVAWTIFGIAVHGTARTLGARRTPAAAAALLAATTPLVRGLVDTLHVDLAFGAFFLAAVALAGAGRPMLAVAAAALMLGVKTSGVPYAALVLAALACAARRPRDSGAGDVAVAAIALLAGGFWYVRNALETGNPFAPAELTLAGHVVLPGPRSFTELRRTTLLHLFDPTLGAHWRVLGTALWGQLGLRGLALALAGAALLRPAGSPPPRSRCAAATLAIATAALYWMTPFGADDGQNGWRITPWIAQGLRYALPALGALAVAAGLGASTVEPQHDRAVALGASGLALAGLTNWPLLAAAGALLPAWGALRIAPRSALALLGVLLLGGSHRLRLDRDRARVAASGGLTAFVDAHVGRDETIGYLLSHRSYLLQGSRPGRPVVYVGEPATDPVAWVAGLRGRGIAVLAVGPVRPEWRARPEWRWLADGTAPLVRVFGTDPEREVVLYRVISRPAD